MSLLFASAISIASRTERARCSLMSTPPRSSTGNGRSSDRESGETCGTLFADGAGCCVVCGDEAGDGCDEEDCGVEEDGCAESPSLAGVNFTATVMYGIGEGAGAASFAASDFDFSASFVAFALDFSP